MAESEKEAGSASKAQKKNSFLANDEIGNDFFTSWKTMSAKGDDALNFNEEAATKGKKSAFNFDKLDMDFSLDGGFGKNLSSFKVDMTDLDFSSPPKKPAKPKEQSAKESNLGKKDKQDHFSFNFDFDELDKFDLGESLMKKDKKLDKSPDDKASNSPRKQEKNQGPRRNLATSIDAPEDGLSFTSRLNKFDTESCLMRNEKKSDKISDDKVSDSPGKQENNQGPRRDIDAPEDEDANKLHKSERVASSNVDLLTRNLGNFKSTNIDSPSASTDSGSFNASQDTRTLQEKEIISSGKGTDECSEQSAKTVYTELNAQEAAQDSSNRSVSVDDSSQDATELQTEFCSSATEVDTNPDGKPNFSVKLIGGLDSNLVKSCNIESLPANCQPKSMDNEFDKKLESHSSDVPMGDLNMDKSIQGDTKVEDASVAIAEKLLSTKSAKENKLIPKLLPTALHSEPKSQKLLPLKVKGTNVHSKPPNQSGEIDNQLKTAVIPKKTYSVIHKFEAPRLSAPDARRQEANPSDAQAGNQKLNSSVSQNKAITKGLPAVLGSEKNNINQNCSSSFQTHSATSIERRTEPKTMKALNSRLLVSSIPSIRNSKSNYFEGNKLSPLEAAKKTFDVTSLKLPVTPKVDLLHTKGQTEMKSLKRSDGNAEKLISPAAKMHCTEGVDQQGLVSPSMKRKMFEVPKAYPVTPHLLTCVTGSLGRNREDRETFERVDNKRVRNNESHLCSFSPTIDIPRNACPLIENDGIVEKAEAYAKELENICNMLKKKNEEVKEILVRAVVNNNNLLMLNHPIYDEKIRNVQRFASQVLSREIHN